MAGHFYFKKELAEMAEETEHEDPANQEEQTQLEPNEEPQEDNKGGDDDLAKWKAMSRKNERFAKEQAKKAKELEERLAQFEEATKSEQDKLIEQARNEARESVLNEVKRERLETNVVRRATGKLNDPDDAVKFIDLDDLVDAEPEEISAAINELIEKKPYLSASETRTVGAADQGARKSNSRTFTREQLANMSPDEYEKHKDEIMRALEAGEVA